MNRLFETVDNVKMQIKKKRRQNQNEGVWGFRNIFGGHKKEDDGWGNQGGQKGGWGSQFKNAIFGNNSLWGNNLHGMDWVKQQLKRQAYRIFNPNEEGGKHKPFNMDDISQIIQQQITFLEPSPAEKKLEQLKRQGKTFYDDRFPPNQTSLTGEYGHVQEWSSIQWKKVSDAMPGAQIFKGKVEPGDIKQGYLGDCYFLAALAALAERPDRIFNLFLLEEVNEVKYYSIKMIYKGKWMTIDMDEYFPFLHGGPAFSKANDNQLWVMLLEKAWAKLYTSYKRIEAGYPEEGLHDLTGAPIKQIYTKQAGFDKEGQWDYLLLASQREYSMVASSRPGSDTNKSESGIVQGHAYTVLNATELNFQGRSERVIQLRNPWGKGQSKGRWSDNDPNWNYISESEKQRIGYNRDHNDGTFFMTYDDFIYEFRALTVAEINDNASYIYKSMKDRNQTGVYFTVQIIKEGYYSFHVDKTPERTFPESKQNQYRYPNAILEVGRLNGNSVQKLQSCQSARRTLFKGYQLHPGRYVAFVRMQFDQRFETDYDVNLAIYAEYACDIQFASREEAVAFTGNHSVVWDPPKTSDKTAWNNLGNTQYHKGDSGWGNQGGNSGGNSGWGNQGGGNDGWGNQQKKDDGWGNQGGSNDGWGNQGGGNQGNNGWGNQGGNDGWGGQPKKDDGWGNQNQGWGQQQQQQGGNQGWGNQGGGDGWGGQQQQARNDGWGSQNPQQSQGWGNQGNNGWGQQQGQQQGQQGGNDGWGNQGGNNGWGQQPQQPQQPKKNDGWGDGW